MTTQASPEEIRDPATEANRRIRLTSLHLWNEWIEMWNGRPELARTIVAHRFTLHLPTPALVRQETVVSPPDVEQWVAAHRAKFRRLVFQTGCGPFVDVTAGVVAGPWFADTSLDGNPRPVCGMDTIAFVEGKVTEYWTIAKEADEVGRWISRG